MKSIKIDYTPFCGVCKEFFFQLPNAKEASETHFKTEGHKLKWKQNKDEIEQFAAAFVKVWTPICDEFNQNFALKHGLLME